MLGSVTGLFKSNLVAIWRQFGNLLFTLVCEPTDNLSLLANTLVLVVEQIVRKFGANKIDKRIVDEPDGIEAVISPFFRQGNPLVVNHSLHRFMIRSEDGPRAFTV